MFMNGDQVDSTGQLVSDTQNGMEAAYRLVGVRSERQSNEINAFYSNKTQMQNKAGLDASLRLATRAALLNGNTDAVPQIYQMYLQNGGDPRQFNRWIQDNYKAANQTRGARQLQQELSAAYKDPTKMAMISRLIDSGVSVAKNESAPDPTTVYGREQGSPMLNQSTSGGLGYYAGQETNPGLQQ